MSDATLSKEATNFLNLLKVRVQEADKVGSLPDDVEEKREWSKLQDDRTAKRTLEQASQSLEKAERLSGMPQRLGEALVLFLRPTLLRQVYSSCDRQWSCGVADSARNCSMST